MELPIKRTADSNNGKASSVFTDEARLRVQVTMVVPRRTAEGVDTLPPITECSTNTSTPTSDYRQQLPISRKFLEAQLAPILQKIQKHEKYAVEQRRNQKRGMDVDATSNNNDDRLQHPSTRAFCSLWEPLRAAVGACNGANYFARRDSGCDSSTIGTRDSWEL